MSSDVSSGSDRPAKPATSVNFESIPETLTDRGRWLLWEYEWHGEKWDKVPIHPKRGHKSDPTSSDTWVSFDEIQEAYERRNTDGVGFAFSSDDLVVGIDLDDCVEADWSDDVIDRLDTWTERSPSKTGYHLYLLGVLPDGGNRSGDVELYDQNRFFTVTGDHVETTPEEVKQRNDQLREIHREYVTGESQETTTEDGSDPSSPVDIDDQELITKAKNAENGDKFRRLWSGVTSGYESHSEADEALCNLLAFWTGKDEQRMDSLFRQSGLMRDKWERDDYAERTISNAVSYVSDVYDPSTDGSSLSNSKGLTDENGVPVNGFADRTDSRVVTPQNLKAEAGLGEDKSIADLNDKQKAAAVWRLIKQSERYHVRHSRDDGTVWGYDNDAGIWKPDGERTLRFACRKGLTAEHYGANVLRELETQVRADPYVEIDADTLGVESGRIAVKNGLVDLSKAADARSDAVRPLEPEDFATSRLTVEYDPDAHRDLWEDFVGDVIEPAKQKAVQEYVGYCLHRGAMPFNRALLLVGSGANGKSTFLNTVRKLLGPENTESKPLHKFGGRWATADLQGKIANIDADLSEGSLSKNGVAMFKRLVGDDTVTAERKQKDPFTFKPDAKHLYACNKVPDVSSFVTDDDAAFWRRWIIVEFPHYFPPDQRDPTLEDRLTSDEALSGVLLWAIQGYARLMDQGHFTNIETQAGEIRRLWQSWGESVDEFIVECLEHDPDADNISTSAVNDIYTEWCRREGKHAEPNRGTVTKKIKDTSDDFGYKQSVRVTDKKNPTNGYTRLGFTDDAPTLESVESDDSSSDDDADGRNSGLGEYK